MIYLASPYSDPCPHVMAARAEKVLRVVGGFAHMGLVMFSPIGYGHQINQLVSLPHTWDFWKQWDTEFIKVAEQLWVLKLPGWAESKGIQAELEIAREHGIPIRYLEPEALYPTEQP